MALFAIRNWSRFQHYRNRNPPWIKLHFELLSSADWVSLNDASRVLAIACMLIGSRNDGQIDLSPDGIAYLQRVAYLNKTPDPKPLILCGFLTPLADASAALADASDSASVSSSVSGGSSPTPVVVTSPTPAPWADAKIPDRFDTREVQESVVEYMGYRAKAGFKKMTGLSWTKLWNRLDECSCPDDVVASFDACIASGNQGVFPRQAKGANAAAAKREADEWGGFLGFKREHLS